MTHATKLQKFALEVSWKVALEAITINGIFLMLILQCHIQNTNIRTVVVQSLELLEKSWKLPSDFPDLENVWKTETKSGKMVKSLEFFFKATTGVL